MQPRSKVWLAKDGVLVFGEGKARLLRAVESTGSLSGAARELDMSYRHAWSAIAAAEKRMGRKLLRRRKGGAKGGGAELTAFARDLLVRFENLDASIRRQTDKCYQSIFGKAGN